ncbi:DUF2730 domain-containing protein [Shinella kummerowiae]|uniref:DUF2730 domain-containing protein n=1 Tax=Shinella kummerowiae TaxID=417745 RepID=UPI0021B4F3FD|nr:DUF2730 domain-containing protein [Shinella kummerowiae]MCT7668212.1 DUF2730 domain-containing protein [Shinella kummerowiae]
MSPAEILLYSNTALAALALLGHAKGYFSSGEKTLLERIANAEKNTDERLTKVEGKLVEHDRRIQTVEGEIKHLPTREAQHQIEIGLEKINGRLDTLAESLKPIRANGEMLNDLLREQVKAASK